MRLAFGNFVIDFGERRMLADDREIHLTPKAFDLLRLLIENRPKALSKQDIFEHLWPGTNASARPDPTQDSLE
jgi:DNA-binding winged helix-turn-helix (wHTH) protein